MGRIRTVRFNSIGEFCSHISFWLKKKNIGFYQWCEHLFYKNLKKNYYNSNNMSCKKLLLVKSYIFMVWNKTLSN